MIDILNGIIDFAAYILIFALNLIEFVIVAYAVLSWLVSFNVVNLRNRAVYQISRFLEAVARPILAPFQRLLPSMGGLDFSPIIALVLIQGTKIFLIPPVVRGLHALVGGPVNV